MSTDTRNPLGRIVKDIPGLLTVIRNGSLIFQPFNGHHYRQDVHAAEYRCVAVNAFGTVVSVATTVRAVMEQVYQGQVYDEYVIRGNTAVFKCQLPSFVRDDVLITNWFVNGNVITNEDSKYVMFGNGDGKLHVLNVGSNDDMEMFTCETRHRLSGMLHLSSESGQLHVTDSRSSIQPQKGHHEQIIYAPRGRNIGLPCAAQSFPPPSYSWLKVKNVGEETLLNKNHQNLEFRGGSLMLNDVTENDSAKYKCFINNSLGHLALVTQLIVTAPLRVHIGKDLQVVDLGKSVALRCIVSGFPIDRIVWTLNGVTISEKNGKKIGQRENIFTIKKMKRIDAGMYQCFVGNHAETVQATAQLVLGDVAPEFLKVFNSRTLQPGPKVSLICIAAGTPEPTINWFLDDENISSNIITYRQALGGLVSIFNITSVSTRDGGVYRCIAKNHLGTIEHMARLNVFGVPGVRRMTNVTVASEAMAYVQCATFGYPISQVLWMKDGMPFTSSGRRTIYKNGTLVISEADGSRDSGLYTCTARNRQGQTARGSRYVTVIDKPVLSDIKFPDDMTEGMRVTVLCTVQKGTPPVTKTWMKDGHPLSLTSELGIVITQTSTYTILNIDKVRRYHSGNYTCEAVNQAGKTSQSARLVVAGSPEWSLRPKDKLAAEGSTTSLHCQGSGEPTPTIQWNRSSRDGHNIIQTANLGFNSAMWDQKPNGTLTLINISKSDQGFYSCKISNEIEPSLRAIARLTVGRSPKIVMEKSTKMVTIGKSMSIECKVSGDSELVVRWRKRSQSEFLSTLDRYEVRRTLIGNSLSLRLAISALKSTDSGMYLCVASNPFGSSKATVEIIVQEKPGPVREVSLMNAKNYSILVSWKQPLYDGKSRITKYQVTYQVRPDGIENRVEYTPMNFQDSGVEHKTTIDGLNPGTQYQLWINAENSIDLSDKSKLIIFRFAENGTLIISSGIRTRGLKTMPNLMLLLVLPSSIIIVLLIIVIVVVYVVLRRNSRRQQEHNLGLSGQSGAKKMSDEQLYKNVGLLSELKEKQTDLRYGKIHSDVALRGSGGTASRYQVLSAPPGATTSVAVSYGADYQKRWSTGSAMYAAGSSSEPESHYYEVSPYATSHLAMGQDQAKKGCDMKTFALPGYQGETGVTAL